MTTTDPIPHAELEELFKRALADANLCAEAYMLEAYITVAEVTGAAVAIRGALGYAMYEDNAEALLPGLRLVADRIHESVERTCRWRIEAARAERS